MTRIGVSQGDDSSSILPEKAVQVFVRSTPNENLDRPFFCLEALQAAAELLSHVTVVGDVDRLQCRRDNLVERLADECDARETPAMIEAVLDEEARECEVDDEEREFERKDGWHGRGGPVRAV